MKIISCETKSTSKYFPIYLRSIYFSIHLLWFQCALKVSFFGPDQKIVFFGFWSKTSFQVRSKARNPDSLLKAGCFRMTEEMLKRPPRCLGLIRRKAISRFSFYSAFYSLQGFVSYTYPSTDPAMFLRQMFGLYNFNKPIKRV